MTALQKWIFSLAAVVVASGISYQWLDRPIALLSRRSISGHAFVLLGQLPDPFLPLAVIVFVSLGLGKLSGRVLSKVQKCAWVCSISLITAVATKAELKLVFGRTWPSSWMGNNPSYVRDGVYGFNFFHGGNEYASFPSGHMAMVCAVIAVFWVYFPAGRAFYILAILTAGAGLVVANYHFLSDVIAGSFVGVTCGWITTKFAGAIEEDHKQSSL
jgi:membrane-associated phospholipid phosphatase